VNRTLTLPNPTSVLSAFLLALMLAAFLPFAVQAQDSTATTANAEARTQFSALLEEATTFGEDGTAEGKVQAGEKFVEAGMVAKDSNDGELGERYVNAMENATKAFMDAGSMYVDAEDYGAGAEQFLRAAEVSAMIENPELQGKAFYNASVAYVSLKDFDSALSSIDSAIVLLPDDLNYLYVRGVTLRSKGDNAGAAEVFTELKTKATEAGDEAMATKADENMGRTYLLAARDALQAEDYAQAIKELDEAAPFLGEDDKTLNTFYANAYYRLGVNQVQAEQFASAKRSLNAAIQHANKSDKGQIVKGAQAQLDYIAQVEAQ